MGIVSDTDVLDKMEHSGFHAHKAPHVNAPIIEELLLTLECEQVSYGTEAKQMISRIVNVSAEESIPGENRKIDAGKQGSSPSSLQPTPIAPWDQ